MGLIHYSGWLVKGPNRMLIKCSRCGLRISKGWLFLGLPWSKYTCKGCGSVFAGTLLRTILVSVATGFLGYIVFGAIKGKINPLLLILALALTLIILFLNLPKQIKRVDKPLPSNESDLE